MTARRVVITTTVADDDMDVNDIADYISTAHAAYGFEHVLIDPTAWEWADFWLDVKDGRVGPDGDKSAIPLEDAQ